MQSHLKSNCVSTPRYLVSFQYLLIIVIQEFAIIYYGLERALNTQSDKIRFNEVHTKKALLAAGELH